MTEDELISLALSRPLSADAHRPTDLHLDRKTGLAIQWADGHKSNYPLAYLRKRCPCATCRTQRDEERQRTPGRSLNILPAGIEQATVFADAKTVGNYAIQITWADGHSTGIYDFKYLRAICPDELTSRASGG